MLSGRTLPLFWFEVVVGLGVPVPDPRDPAACGRTRAGWRSPPAIAIVGIFVHRLNLVLNGLSYAQHRAAAGRLPIGVRPGRRDLVRDELLVRARRSIEWLVVIGVLAFGALLFTLAVLFLPMQEPEAH